MPSKNEITAAEADELMSPRAIRAQAAKIFDLAENGGTSFRYCPEKFQSTVDYVLQTIRKNYPSLKIPFHSRWGHFQVGGVDRVGQLNHKLAAQDKMERARIKLDLAITSVLLDAGAGPDWEYREQDTGRSFTRSEGLGVASLHMFLAGAMSQDRTSLRADEKGLAAIDRRALEEAFQVSVRNPLIGCAGRAGLLNSLGRAVADRKRFRDGRPGNIVDYLVEKHGRKIPATALLGAVLDGFGSIWPSRLSAPNGRNLGDVWCHSRVGLVPFHKLSQWMTYSLIEPMLEADLSIERVHELTGLAEYRNGGLIIDTGLVELRDGKDVERTWRPESDLIIEWRALTVYLLDKIGVAVRKELGKSEEEFPLAKVLEGGTWWAGRFIAREKRKDGSPPLKIESDGTVF